MADETDLIDDRTATQPADQPAVEDDIKTSAEPSEGDGVESTRDPGEDTEDEAEAPKEEKPKTRAQKRVEAMVRERNEAVRIAAQAQREAREAREQLAQVNLRQPHEYDSDTEYLRDLTRLSAREQQVEDRLQQSQYAQEIAEDASRRAWQASVAETKQKYKDFDDVVYRDARAGGPQITPLMVEAMASTEVPGEVAYYLAKNTSEAARISRLSVVEQTKAIFALERKLSAPNARSVTTAPAPTSTLSGRTGMAKKSLSDMSYAEYKKARGFD